MKYVTLDLSDAIMTSQELSAILDTLKKAGLYEEHHLYTVIDGSRLEEFLELGTYRPGSDTIFAFKRSELMWTPRTQIDECLNDWFNAYDKPAIVVYNGRKLTPEMPGVQEYRFKDATKKMQAVDGIVDRIIFECKSSAKSGKIISSSKHQ